MDLTHHSLNRELSEPLEAIQAQRQRLMAILEGETKPEPVSKTYREPLWHMLLNLEGTCYAGKNQNIEPELILLYSHLFRIAKQFFPKLTFHIVTGRDESFVEAFTNAIQARWTGPHVTQYGTRIYISGGPDHSTPPVFHPESGRTVARPTAEHRDEFETIRTKVKEEFGELHEEPGKNHMMTLNPPEGTKIDDLYFFVARVLADPDRKHSGLKVSLSTTGVDVYPSQADPMLAVERIITRMGSEKPNCVYFGDAPTDIDHMGQVGFAVAPRQSHPDVIHFVHNRQGQGTGLVAQFDHGFGVVSAMYQFMEHYLWYNVRTSEERRFHIFKDKDDATN